MYIAMLNLHTHITLCWQQLYHVFSPSWQYEFCSLLFWLKEKSFIGWFFHPHLGMNLANFRMGYGRNELRGRD
jgi:hypothetical protein